jgi:phage recombination protein Bet
MNEIANVKTDVITEAVQSYLSMTGNKTKLSKEEQTHFLEIARAYGLNPLKQEIFIVAYGSGTSRQFSIITSYRIYIRQADRSGKLNGWRAWVEGSGNNLVGVVEIKRKDWDSPFRHEVYFEEVRKTNSFWKQQPKFMLKKVAIGQAFRLCFPDDLDGLTYTSDEISNDNADFVITTPPSEKGEDLAAQAAQAAQEAERTERRRLLIEIGTFLKHPVFTDEEVAVYKARILEFGNVNRIAQIEAMLEEVKGELNRRTAEAEVEADTETADTTEEQQD